MRPQRNAITIEELKAKLLDQRKYLDHLYNGPSKDTPAVRQLVIAHNEGKERMLAELIKELGHLD